MKNLKWIFAVAAVALTVSCCPCRKNKSKVPLTGIEWKLIQLYGTAIDSENYRVTFGADGSVSGVGDCNRFAGTFTMNVGALKVGENLVSTRMMCPHQQQEDSFLKMLAQADAYFIDGTRLMMIRGGEVISMFDPAQPAE